MKLSNEELLNVQGGAVKWIAIAAAAASLITFGIGFADGYFRLVKCNK